MVEERRQVLTRFASCFRDDRDPARIEHTVEELLAQRVCALALGYEDISDHDTLRLDPLLAALVGMVDPESQRRPRARDEGKDLAASTTLLRLELAHPDIAPDDRYKRIALEGREVDDLSTTRFLEAHNEAPKEVILDFDTTDDRVHGKQQGRFGHGHCDHDCYMSLYVFAGGQLLGARLRTADRDGADGTLDKLERLVPRIRGTWPKTCIIVRGDSGSCREWLMA
ncbi:MAG: transposase [Planctomycetota bacterium]|nr:transposase [Planctomycetota bacterium]